MIRHARALISGSIVVVTGAVAVAPAVAVRAAPEGGVEQIVLDATVDLDSEILVLVELGAFGTGVPQVLLDVHAEWESYTDGLTRGDLMVWLRDVDQQGAAHLGDLVAAGVPASPETRSALGLLGASDLERLDRGATIGLDPVAYVKARGHLHSGNGAGPGAVGGQPVAPAPTTTIRPTATPRPTPPTATPATTAAPAGSSSAMPVLLGAAVAIALVALALAWSARRRRAPDAAAAGPTPAPGPIGPDELFDLLSDAARQMTNALDAREIAHIALDQAMQMVGSRHGAFIDVGSGGLAALATSGDLLDVRSLHEGVLSRVADTGQSVRRIAHDEPAITSLPAAVLAVPVIRNGRVSAIVFLIRPDTSPFTADEESTVVRLAPIIGSALGAASKHGDATALSRLDALTGLGNRRKLDEDLAELLGSAHHERGTGVVMIDVDHFKHFNDRNGHAAGDEALRAVAAAMRSAARDHDRVYRYGGEEFTVLLGDVDRDQAQQIAERLRASVEQCVVPGGTEQPGGALTISVGAALVAGLEPDNAVRLADGALYEAKSAGRNCVVVVDGADRQPA